MFAQFAQFAQLGPTDIVNEVVDTTGVTEWDVVLAVGTVILAAVFGHMLALVARRAGRKASLPPNVVDLISTIARWGVTTVGFVAAMSMIGLNVAPLWLLVVLIILMFAIGGRALLEAFGAGVMLQARAPFAAGDLVELAGVQGVVVEVNSRVVVLDTIDGRRVYLPNQQVLRSEIINLTAHGSRMSHIYLDVAYGTNLDDACRIAVAAAQTVDVICSEPEPIAEVASLEASAVRIRLRFWHDSHRASEWAATDAAVRAAYSAYDEQGVDFAFPQQTLWWGPDQKPT
jgi:small conductance mechanosensitive channel